jgi:soluble lytic murein transglycosylase
MTKKTQEVTGMEFALLCLCFLFFISFIGVAFQYYDLKNEVTNQKTQLADSIKSLDQVDKKLLNVITSHSENIIGIDSSIEKLTSQTEVLEASLDSREKRWARIKKVRDAIKASTNTLSTITEVTNISGAVIDWSDSHDVPVSLVLAQMRAESNFNIKIVSHAGAVGLMQVMPSTAKDIASEVGQRRYSLYNSKDNIRFGTYYIWKMLDTFNGDMDLAIRAYNAGPTFVSKVESGEWTKKFQCDWGEENYFCETADYHKKVLKFKKEFEDLGL